MKKSILVLIMVATGFFCSAQNSRSTQDSAYTGPLDSVKATDSSRSNAKHSTQDSAYTGNSDSVKATYSNRPNAKHSSQDSVYTGNSDSTRSVPGQKSLTGHNEKDINTKYEYTEGNGARLVIQNGFPRSTINYTDPDGKKYIYAVFWTRVINETFDPLELTIDFPPDSFEMPSSSGNHMKLLHSGTMTIDKDPFSDYNILKSFLDNNRHQSSSLKRTIQPKGSSTFYVITLSDRGVGGALRAGLNLKDQNLFYRINDKEIPCGKINLKNLRLYK